MVTGPSPTPIEAGEKEEKPWMVWRFNKHCTKTDCDCCGYWWGPGHRDKAGQKCVWPK